MSDYCTAAILHERISVNSFALKKFSSSILADFDSAHSVEGGAREPEESEESKKARGRKIYDDCAKRANARTISGFNIEGLGMGELHHYANNERERSVGWHPDRSRWEGK